jgi:ribosome-associated protein
MKVEILNSELNFKAVRSSGAGGQNVNKVSSKMVLIFDVATSHGLDDAEKLLLQTKLKRL